MYKGKDMLGQKFGSLEVIAEAVLPNQRARHWVVMCVCGAEKTVLGSSLRSGRSTSCGSCAHKTHGMSRTSTYGSWKAMVERCCDPNCKDYPRYGGSGVGVHPRWRDFSKFFLDMGVRPLGTTLDRIHGGNYEPGNCRWATPLEQAFNRNATQVITYGGVSDSPSGWARRLGISRTSMVKRLAKWSLAQALTKEPRKSDV